MVTLKEIKEKLLTLETLEEKLEYLEEIKDKIKDKKIKKQINELIKQINLILLEREKKLPGTVPIETRTIVREEEPKGEIETLETKLVGVPSPTLPEEVPEMKYGGGESGGYKLYKEEPGREMEERVAPESVSSPGQRLFEEVTQQSSKFQEPKKDKKLIKSEDYMETTRKYKERK